MFGRQFLNVAMEFGHRMQASVCYVIHSKQHVALETVPNIR